VNVAVNGAVNGTSGVNGRAGGGRGGVGFVVGTGLWSGSWGSGSSGGSSQVAEGVLTDVGMLNDVLMTDIEDAGNTSSEGEEGSKSEGEEGEEAGIPGGAGQIDLLLVAASRLGNTGGVPASGTGGGPRHTLSLAEKEIIRERLARMGGSMLGTRPRARPFELGTRPGSGTRPLDAQLRSAALRTAGGGEATLGGGADAVAGCGGSWGGGGGAATDSRNNAYYSSSAAPSSMYTQRILRYAPAPTNTGEGYAGSHNTGGGPLDSGYDGDGLGGGGPGGGGGEGPNGSFREDVVGSDSLFADGQRRASAPPFAYGGIPVRGSSSGFGGNGGSGFGGNGRNGFGGNGGGSSGFGGNSGSGSGNGGSGFGGNGGVGSGFGGNGGGGSGFGRSGSSGWLSAVDNVPGSYNTGGGPAVGGNAGVGAAHGRRGDGGSLPTSLRDSADDLNAGAVSLPSRLPPRHRRENSTGGGGEEPVGGAEIPEGGSSCAGMPRRVRSARVGSVAPSSSLGELDGWAAGEALKVTCLPTRFDFEFPIIKPTKRLVEIRSGT